MDFELERFMHLYAMNRGILLTPFHNMALISPQTPTVIVLPRDDLFAKNISTVEEIKARGGPVIAITHPGEATTAFDRSFEIPALEPELDPDFDPPHAASSNAPPPTARNARRLMA